MANIIGLALKVTGDASGLAKGLTPVDRALDNLAKQAERATSVFQPLADKTAVAAQAQEEFAARFERISQQLRDNVIAPAEYAAAFGQLTEEAKKYAEAIDDGLRLTQQNQTAEEARAAALARLKELLSLGAIDARNFGLEAAKLSSGFDGPAAERFAEAIAPLRAEFESGAISAERFAVQSEQIAAAISSSTPAAQRQAEAILELRDRFEAGRISIEQYRDEFSRIQSGDLETRFELSVVGVRESVAASDEVRQSLALLTDKQITAALQIAGVEQLDDLRARLAGLDGQQIDAVLSVLGVDSIKDASQRINELDGTSIDAQLRVLGIDGIEDARNLLASVEGKNIDVIAKTLGFDSVELLTQAIDAAESKTVTFNVDGNAEEQTQRVAELVKDQEEYRKAIAEGALITEQVRTAEERRARELERIDALLARGAINEETAARKRDQITGASQAAAAAELELARAKEQAARIIEASLTASERAQRQYDQAVQVAQDLERRGLLTKEQFNTEIRRQADIFAKAAVAAAKYDTELDKAANSDLKFNELSGILSLLPGQIGGVASRLSSFASAGEGIQKIFAGGVTNAMTGLAGSLTGLLSPATLAAAGIVGVGAAAQQIVAGLTQLEDRVEQLGNTADKLGVSFEFIQTLEEAANRSGASIEAVSAAFGRLQKSVLGVDEESKAAQKALEDIGVTTQQLTDLRPEEQYQLIGDRLASIEEPAKRTAAAVALFGRAGADLIPFFNNIAGAAVDVERFNATLSSIDRTRIDALGSSFDAVTVSLRGFGQELLTPFIGITQSISSGLASAFASVGRSVGAVLDAISPLTSAIGLLANGFLQSTSVILNFLGTAIEPAAATGRLLSGVFDNISQVVTSVSGRVNDAVIGFREFFKFQEIADQFAAAFDRIGEALSRVGVIVSRFAEVTVQAVGRVGTVVREGVSQFLEFTGLGGVISRFAEGVTAAFAGLWDGIREIVGQVGGFIERVLTFAEDWLGIVPEIEEPVVATVEVDGTGAIDELLKQSKDFQKSLDDITGSVSKAIDESAKFGEAGFDAALRYQESIERLKDQLDAGLFNEETFRREAARAAETFRSELSAVEADIRISEETEKTLANLQERINAAAAGAQQFGQAGFDAAAQFQDKLRELGQQFEDGRINAATLAAETANVTAEYGRQIDGFKQAEQLQQSILKADRDRVNALVAQGNKTTELEENAAAIRREQLRIEEEIRRQREAGNVFAAEAAAARLAQLDQVAAKTEELQQAAEQGFADGFARSFEATNRTIDELIDKAAEFGNVGANAAQQLEAAIESAQQQARDGILTRETYEREVARQRQIFAERLAGAKRVEEFLRGQLDERQRAELDAAAAVEERQRQAVLNVKALQDRIDAEQKALEAARGAGRLQEARAGTIRLNQLRQAQRIEQGIADGREASGRGQVTGFARGFSQIEQFQTLVARQNQNFLQSFSNTFGAANASLAAAGALAAEQARRAELSRPVEGAVRTADIRTAEGAALVLGLGAAEQDPALIEARLQTRQLNNIRTAIVNAVQGYLNTPVEIL